jgi:hypothetical protein
MIVSRPADARIARASLVAALLLMAGCKQSPEPPAPESSARKPAARPAAPSETDLTGVWTVVGHQSPGISALSDDEAKARYGETVRLTLTEAVSARFNCDEPMYATSAVPAEEYLATEFKLAPGSLKPLGSREQVRLMEVSCRGKPWADLGGTLLEIDADRALTPWDGVFFELQRDHDFRALGQEPGWQLEIRKGLGIRFQYDYGDKQAVTPMPRAETDPQSGDRSYHAVTETNDLQVVIQPKRCADTMSGKPFPATVTVTLDGREFRGCGNELATP